jgi:hypothetical protein
MTVENFITNLIILGVENLIMARLPTLLTTDAILQLDRKMLESLAGESEDDQAMREELQTDVTKLSNGLEQCREWRRASRCKFLFGMWRDEQSPASCQRLLSEI